jgi:hypothetical protein
MRHGRRALPFLVFLAAQAVGGEVVRVDVSSRKDLADGKSFGLAGAYEKVAGRMHFAVRPDDPRDRAIVDIELAPRDANGRVEFSADFYILKPKDSSRASGTLLLEVPNRGGKAIFALLHRAKGSDDPETAEELGDGFLLRRGVTVAWVGWQWDVREEPGRMRLNAPVARQNAQPITGLVRSDFVVEGAVPSHPLAHVILGSVGGTGYPAAEPKSKRNVLTERDSPLGTRRTIARRKWRFARDVEGKQVPDDRWVTLDGGFQPGKIYEVVYLARDPVVAGLGLAAIRDAASYFKHDPQAVAPARRVYGAGISQSGRFLRQFVKQGFNADEQGRQAFDGLFVHVAGAGVGSFNHRFAQPSRDAQVVSTLFYPTDLFPFTDLPETDPDTGETGGLLDRARTDRVAPRIFTTNTSYEYWGRAGSLIHTSPDGKTDSPMADETRVYFLAGLQHFTGPFPPTSKPYRSLRALHPQNPHPVWWIARALFDDMEQWVRDGISPPNSRYPLVSNGALVLPETLKFPRIPGLSPPSRAHLAYRMDFGPLWKDGIITKEPPGVGKPYPSLVPRVDADGNDLGGVRIPEMEVPVATTTGWNQRDPGIGFAGERATFIGSYVPFPATRADRERAFDQRQSIEERYGTKERYLGLFAQAALRQIEDRFLLPEDLADVLARGAAEWEAVAKRPNDTKSDNLRLPGQIRGPKQGHRSSLPPVPPLTSNR